MQPIYRESRLVKSDDGNCLKNTSEPAEESLWVIRTARSSRNDAMKWIASAVNLGGIAEDLPFVPCLGREVFCFYCLPNTK